MPKIMPNILIVGSKDSIHRQLIVPFITIVSVMTVTSAILFSAILSKKVLAPAIVISVIINMVIFVVYSSIIRRFTQKLDYLTQIALKVSNGDFTQKILINTDDEVGQLSRAFNGMIQNIKESSLRLTEEKNRSEAVISCIPEGIIVTDTENHLILANERAESIFKFSSEKAQGKLLLEYLNNEDLIAHFREEVQWQGKRLVREIHLPDAEGKDRIYALISSPVIASKDEGRIGIITIIRDVTQEKELGELRDGFLRTVTHELRTPLTSIIGFLELIKGSTQQALSDQTRKWIQIALHEAANLKELIDDLLDLSQIRAGRMRIQHEYLNVVELFSSLVQTFQPLAQRRQLDLIAGAVDPSLEISADGSKLRRILVNLISNALKFTQVGYIRLDCVDDAHEIIFSVTDTGIGLREDETEVIFEKFRQIDYSSTRKYEGIGLGLSIVKQLVEMHGGRVWVVSVFGKGSTFYFSLPKTS